MSAEVTDRKETPKERGKRLGYCLGCIVAGTVAFVVDTSSHNKNEGTAKSRRVRERRTSKKRVKVREPVRGEGYADRNRKRGYREGEHVDEAAIRDGYSRG